VLLGPRTYGLPYRLAKLDYRTDELRTGMSVDVQAANDAGRMQFECESDPCFTPVHAETGSLDEFLLERYTAFTFGGARARNLLFRVWHEPWMQRSATVRVGQRSLLALTDASLSHARLAGGHLSAGVTDVWIGRPRPC
jgi:uncharacterized protein YqjF (DUF2071 family)